MATHIVLWFDEPQRARQISCRLMRADFEVHTVHDDFTASELLDHLHPQLLVTDGHSSRLELLQQAYDAAIPVIGLASANDRTATLDDLQSRGLFSAVFSLPCSLHQLVDLAHHLTQAEPVVA